MGKKTATENNIHEVFAKNTFVKVKPAFEIGKVLFAFVEMDAQKKQKKTIDCYLNVSEAALLGKKITSFRMYQMIDAEKQKGAKYPEDVWKSPLGGVNEQEAKQRGLRTDGNAVSRIFSIAPGASQYGQYAVITARSQAGKTNKENGLIEPIKDNNATVIRVAIGTHDELEELGIMLEAAANVYIQERCKKNFTVSPAISSDEKIDKLNARLDEIAKALNHYYKTLCECYKSISAENNQSSQMKSIGKNEQEPISNHNSNNNQFPTWWNNNN